MLQRQLLQQLLQRRLQLCSLRRQGAAGGQGAQPIRLLLAAFMQPLQMVEAMQQMSAVIGEIKSSSDETARILALEAGEVIDAAVMHVAELREFYAEEIDRAREEAMGRRAIGTTCRGIGPAYEDKASRRGVRVADLLSE